MLLPVDVQRGRGYDPECNKSGDIIYANTPVMRKDDGVGIQYFWEAFPAGSGPGDRCARQSELDPRAPDPLGTRVLRRRG